MAKTIPLTNSRESVDQGKVRMRYVTSVYAWYKAGYFESDAAACGAFRLAYQQGLDGLGDSIQSWMGLTDEQFDAWMSTGCETKDMSWLK